MGDYYNVTRGPLSVTLNDGSAASVTPKKWFYVSPANEGSASLQQLVSKGFLVRAKVPITQPEVEVEVVEVAPDAVPAPVPAPVPYGLSESPKSEVSPAPTVVEPKASKGDRFGGKSR